MKNHEKLNWINSTGGPLILMDEISFSNWKGSLKHNGISDYERACMVDDYLGLVEFEKHLGLVLGDEPNQTSWINIGDSQGIIVRWVWADSEDEIKNALRNVSLWQNWEETDLQIKYETGKLKLFDSSLDASADKSILDCLDINLNSGVYSIETLFYQPTERLNLILHKLEHVSYPTLLA
jgi:Immunity protein 21